VQLVPAALDPGSGPGWRCIRQGHPHPTSPSYPRRRVSRAPRTNPACRPGPRITSGVTMCQTRAPFPWGA